MQTPSKIQVLNDLVKEAKNANKAMDMLKFMESYSGRGYKVHIPVMDFYKEGAQHSRATRACCAR